MSTISTSAYLSEMYSSMREIDKFIDYPDCSQKINAYGLLMQDPSTVIDKFMVPETIEMEMARKYVHKPEHLSLALYGETYLWHLLMKLNNCQHRSDFDFSTVTVLEPTFVNTLKNFVIARSDEISTVHELEDLTIKQVIL